MSSTGLGSGGLQTGISLTGLGTIANGATGISAAFTIPYVSNASAALCDQANLQLSCTSFTPSATSPYLQGVFITEDDGSNYDPYWVANAQLFPIDLTLFTKPLKVAATTLVKRKGLILPSCIAGSANVQLVILNESGVSMTVSSATLYPYGSMAG